MKLQIGTSIYTKYVDEVPHAVCFKQCDTCFLWYAGWRVRIYKIFGLKLLKWTSNGLSLNKK